MPKSLWFALAGIALASTGAFWAIQNHWITDLPAEGSVSHDTTPISRDSLPLPVLADDSGTSADPQPPQALRDKRDALKAKGILCAIGFGESTDEQIAMTMSEDAARAQMARERPQLNGTSTQQSVVSFDKPSRTYRYFSLVAERSE